MEGGISVLDPTPPRSIPTRLATPLKPLVPVLWLV
jgi:hypothetical protein